MLEQALRDFLMLFVTIDPIGTLALFVPLTAGVEAAARRRLAMRAVVYSACVLLGFLVAGQVLLAALGVRLASFQLAGGAILFLLGLQMVFGTGVASGTPEPDHDVAVFPLAMPSIASPGSIMAVVLLTDNHRHSIAQQAVTALILLLVLVVTAIVLLLAHPIDRLLGRTGESVLIRIMGLLLAALAAEQIVAAVELITSSRAPL
jgi:multiple antibiotic resistance protein